MMKKMDIIFDLGGVLLNIDYNAPIHAFQKLGIANFENHFKQASQSGIFDDFEKGKINNKTFRDEIRKLANLNLSDEQIDHAWNSILLDMPNERMKLLENLKENHRLFLLSNTNNIHIPQFEKTMDEEYGKGKFHSFFNNVYYSSQIGMRKPDAEIFEFVLKENNLIPEATIFIDDSIQHVNGAEKLGIKAYHLNLNDDNLIALLKRISIL